MLVAGFHPKRGGLGQPAAWANRRRALPAMKCALELIPRRAYSDGIANTLDGRIALVVLILVQTWTVGLYRSHSAPQAIKSWHWSLLFRPF